jgi:mannose-6-phosphate isomerase-like protein (cupin superfamily)
MPELEQTEYLNGKVTRRRLPQVDPAAFEKPRVKRLMLPQGELAQFYDGEQGGMQYLAFLELVPGTVRGNHYHHRKREFVYLQRGSAELVVRDLKSGGQETVSLEAGDLAFIDVEVAHCMRAIGGGHALEFSNEKFDVADVEKFTLTVPG